MNFHHLVLSLFCFRDFWLFLFFWGFFLGGGVVFFLLLCCGFWFCVMLGFLNDIAFIGLEGKLWPATVNNGNKLSTVDG